jgi:hypothetical protein
MPILFALALPGCTPPAPPDPVAWPALTLSEATLDFGDVTWGSWADRTVMLGNEGGMPMGIGSVEIGDETTAFTVTWRESEIACASDTKAEDADTGGGGGGGGDTGTGDPADTGDADGEPCDDALFVLDPQCEVPITLSFAPTEAGQVYDALVVRSVAGCGVSSLAGLTTAADDDTAAPPLPAYMYDPVHTVGVTYLGGSTEHAVGQLVAAPWQLDFGNVYPGRVTTGDVTITNIGDAAMALGDVTLDGCGADFSLSVAPADTVLAALEASVATVTFAPTSTAAQYCELVVYDTNPRIELTLQGNTGTGPNSAPTVSIVSPAGGQPYSTTADFSLTLALSDADQPPSSLTCTVQSAVLGTGVLGSCTPTDDSGLVTVDLAASGFGVGSDTLLVTVVDAQGLAAYATVSMLIDVAAPADDDDGDGFGAADDCDDTDAATYPSASEIYDGADNDCDGITDEDTEGYDDDGDGVSEADGDTDDRDDNTYPGAPERGDGKDNDGDGLVDEGTVVYDDDGDGYAEVNNDCDDDDPAVHPGALELCDGLDNDCDGLRDTADGCVSDDTDPYIVGDVIWLEQNGMLEGETIACEVHPYDPDGDAATYAWSTDGDGIFDDQTAARVTFTAPSIEEGYGRNERIYAVLQDVDGHQDWAFDKVAVYDASVPLYDGYTPPASDGGCGGCGGGGASGLIGVGLLAAARRRRP